MPEALLEAVRAASSVALVSHVNPDGDAIGSALAMRLALEALGKRVENFCQDKVPDQLLFLPGADAYRLPESLGENERFDLLLCIDVSDEKRMGSCGALRGHCALTAQVDHHATNPGFAQINVVDGAASASALLVKALIDALGAGLNRQIATCLYVGLSTDTGNFAFNNTTPEAFAVMAELMEQKLPLSELNRVLFQETSKPQLLLLRSALNSLQLFHNDEIAVMMLSRQDFADCGALPEHADNLVNHALNMKGVRMAVLAREADKTHVKMSLRAIAPDRVSDIAVAFGGGGHPQAAGCTLEGTLGTCTARVVEAMLRCLDA